MAYEDLIDRYEQLRNALEDAYLAPQWDSERIDRLAEQLRSAEIALMPSVQPPSMQLPVAGAGER